MEEFYILLEGVTLRYQEDDTSIWLEDASNLFMVKSTYLAIYKLKFGSSQEEIFKCLQHLKVPPKVAFFIWRLLLDRLPTKANLSRRNAHFENDNLSCVLCHEFVKVANHLFFSCGFAHNQWKKWYNLFWYFIFTSESYKSALPT